MLLKIDNQKYIDNKKENFAIKKLFVKPVFIAAVMALFVMSFAMTSYGQGFYRVIKEVFVGEHAKYIVTEQSGSFNVTVPKGCPLSTANYNRSVLR